jgi:hypothetical protein
VSGRREAGAVQLVRRSVIGLIVILLVCIAGTTAAHGWTTGGSRRNHRRESLREPRVSCRPSLTDS